MLYHWALLVSSIIILLPKDVHGNVGTSHAVLAYETDLIMKSQTTESIAENGQ